MNLGKALTDLAFAPVRVGLAVADAGIGVAKGGIEVAYRTLGEPKDGAKPGSPSLAYMLGIDDAVERANRLARLMDEDQPLGRALAPDGALDRLLRPGGVVDRLRQLGLKVIDVNGGSRASNSLRFRNKRAEMWSRMRDWLRDVGDIPDDDELMIDLQSPEYGFDARNRMQIEKKEDMKRRGVLSPDIADALALTFAEIVHHERMNATAGLRVSPSGFDPLEGW